MSKLPGHAIIVDIPTASPEKAKKWVELMTPVAKHALHNEPKTYTYHWTLPVGGDEKTYKGIEIYENRSALEDVHSSSAPFGEFVKGLEKEQIMAGPLKIEHAIPVAGFLVRPGAPNHGNYPGSFIWTGKFVTHPGKSDEVVEALKENLPYIESSEPETISFLVLKGADEPDVVYVWERYTSESALRDIHHKSAGYARLREKTGSLFKTREIDGYYEVTGFLTKEGGMI